MAEVVWPQSLIDLMLEMPEAEIQQIMAKVRRLETFPEMYPVRTSGSFRGHRWFFTGSWVVYYRFVEGKVYVRALWPAGRPPRNVTSNRPPENAPAYPQSVRCGTKGES
jgi:plasmid stabilization system protein ParE